MKYTKPLTRLERWIQAQRARLHRSFDEYDLDALVNVSLLGIVFVWWIWLMVFEP